MRIPDPSLLLVLAFLAVVLGATGLLVALAGQAASLAGASAHRVRLAVGGSVLGWMALSAALARSGLLMDFTLPPKVMALAAVSWALAVGLAFSRTGTRMARHLPTGSLVALSAFRLPLELTMHRAATEGLMPPQMSFSGMNYDIVTGVLAVALATYSIRRRAPTWAIASFNAIGFALLLNVLAIAILSMPTPLRAFPEGPPNVWIATFPFVWLPAVLVPIALFTHVALLRRQLNDRARLPATNRAMSPSAGVERRHQAATSGAEPLP